MNIISISFIAIIFVIESSAQQTNPAVKSCYDKRKVDVLKKTKNNESGTPTFQIADVSVTKEAAVEFKNIISEEDLGDLSILEDCVGEFDSVNVQKREFGHNKEDSVYSGNHVTFLNGYYKEILPQFNVKLTQALTKATEAAGWDVTISPLGLRCVEILNYNPHGELRPHVDEGSVYTLAIALSDADSFSGGEFFIKDQEMKDSPSTQELLDAKQHVITPSKLGGTLFRSHLVHGVQPVTEGYRKMFVIEYWKNRDGEVNGKRRNPEFFRDALGLSPVW
eukprot:CAMPEP_0119053292 /NCGR_PEP_ID=MMETSP1177-20130426/74341_1 /TAXON_ID=2985 /ORGANISM="Ochromonas sp, Strain CCMP1899" /LENGTH=278 /DNA_ID=CAMNT_0007033215 /DNA_START=120 /DNA_END=953 /DNA_ORIENTATION=-